MVWRWAMRVGQWQTNLFDEIQKQCDCVTDLGLLDLPNNHLHSSLAILRYGEMSHSASTDQNNSNAPHFQFQVTSGICIQMELNYVKHTITDLNWITQH